MTEIAIRRARPDEEDATCAVITLAFGQEPPVRWLYPDALSYLANFGPFLRAFAGRAFKHGSAYVAEGCIGAALWLPPGVHSDDAALDAVLARSLPDHRKSDVAEVFEQMASFHPTQPHWHLAMIGVDSMAQNRGVGTALLRCGLAVCDQDDQTVYLESTNSRNLSLYERHGFELVGTIEARGCPPMYPMVRKARSGK